MTVYPRSDVVVIRHRGGTYTGAIALLPNRVEEADIGEVVAIGPGRRMKRGFVPTTIKPGDKVIYSQHLHEKAKLDGDRLLICRETDIIGVCE